MKKRIPRKLTEEDLAILLKELDIGAIIKESLLDEAIFGESMTIISKDGIRRVDPMSDEFKILKHNCRTKKNFKTNRDMIINGIYLYNGAQHRCIIDNNIKGLERLDTLSHTFISEGDIDKTKLVLEFKPIIQPF